jgi:hypothetical protein
MLIQMRKKFGTKDELWVGSNHGSGHPEVESAKGRVELGRVWSGRIKSFSSGGPVLKYDGVGTGRET